MAITRIKNSTIGNKTPKYNDVLAGLPFRPIIGTASDGGNGTSASVAFTGNNVANGTITYTALSSPGSFTGTGTASPITVSGLTSGTAYTFQVKAGNSLGDSAYSAASNSVTPVTPTSFESIATVTATGGETSLTFSNIPQTYQHLHIRGLARDTSTASVGTVSQGIQINGNSTANYAYHTLPANGVSIYPTGATSSNGVYTDYITPFDNQLASTFGAMIIDIHDYTSTTKRKTIRVFGGCDLNGANNFYGVTLASGFLTNSTSAVTSITFPAPWTSFKAGTTFALYGIKG